MMGVRRAARNMRLPPPEPGEKWYHRLGMAFVIALIPVAIMTGMVLLHRGLYYMFKPTSQCTCEMVKNHECPKP